MKVAELRAMLQRIDGDTDILIVDKDHIYRPVKYSQIYEAGRHDDGTYSVWFPEAYKDQNDKREPKKVLILA